MDYLCIYLQIVSKTDIPVRTGRSYESRYKDHKPFDKDFTQPKVKDKTGVKRNKWDTTDKATYVFLPIVFKDGKPMIEWRDEWRLEDYDIPTREQVGPNAMPQKISPVEAPFSFRLAYMQYCKFERKKVTVKMNKNGISTKNIQNVIDKMARNGGGTVCIPAGKWLTGRLELKSDVKLHLEEGAELHFSGNIKDYLPVVFTRDEGIEMYSLGAFIYANKANNIAITGKGRIVGPSIECEIYKNNKENVGNIETLVADKVLQERIYDGSHNNGEVFLPKTIAPINCTNVLVEGITLDQGLYWNVVPQYCDGVIIRGVTVNSFGHGRTDGIDVESSRNVLVEYCSLDCQDDCYTMKSGRGADGLRVGLPTENVVVRHCLALRGAGGIVCGTEVAGGVRNIYCHDCVFDGTDQAFRVKTLRPRGGGVENLIIERVRADVTGAAFYCDMLGSVKWGGELAKRFPIREVGSFTPDFNTITIDNVVIGKCKQLVFALGLPEQPLRNVLFSRVKAHCTQFMKMRDVQSFILKDANIYATDSTASIDGCTGIMMLNVKVNGGKHGCIGYDGEESTPVIIR